MKYATVDEVATLVHHRGPTTLPGTGPDHDQGRVVVCLHDAGSSCGIYSPLLDRLAADHSPLAYDQPGHGRSGSLDALPTLAAMADHLIDLVRQWSLGPVVAVGDGLGAAIALETASRSPQTVDAVVTLGRLVTGDALDPEIDRLAMITAGRARREFDQTGYAPDTAERAMKAAFAAWVRTDPRATLGARRAQRAWVVPDQIPVPVLVVVGEATEDDARAEAENLAATIDSATAAELAGAGRRGQIEQPEALAGLIDRFITGGGGA
ncbi:MAG: alpha/beta fold hydrolase [Acidimicrobiales bacterium]